MAGRFAARVALVTGGASGIGAATVEAFAAEGARVVIADVDRERGTALAARLGVDFEAADVSDGARVEALIAHTATRLGRLDVLVASAFATAVGAIERLTPAA